jgi:hypothetical protein
VADKNFKVKSGLQVPSLTTAGPVTTDSSGNVTSSATLPITQGGTGQTTAGNALNALLPLQTSQDNKFLQTNGVSTQWTIPQQQTSTDGTLGYKVYSGTVTPSSPVTGDIWIDQTTGNGIQLVRWRKTIASTTTTLSALDDNNLTLSYTAGNEQVYINGVLITRGQDYTATNGTSVVLTQAAEIGDTVEIFGNPLFSVTDVYTQAQSNSLYVSKSGFDAAGKNYLINGGMDFWQRGTTANANIYSADRWKPNFNSQRYQDAPVSSGLVYSLGPTSSQSMWVYQTTIELPVVSNLAPFNNGVWTFSFYAKVDSGQAFTSQAYACNDAVGTNQAAAFMTGSHTGTGAWQRYSVSGTATAINSGNTCIRVVVYNLSGSTNTVVRLTGAQFEQGITPTPFSRAGGTIAGELAACQRYFQRFGNSVAYEPFGVAHGIDVNNARMYLPLKINMRTNPTFSSTAASTFQKSFGTTSGLSTIALGSSSNHAVSIDFSRTSEFTANGGFIISSVAAGNAYIDLSAEL